ncbi:MAG: zf-HC2 domain-containing protein [Pseudomonadales bacterium]|nr:zf-HC2 domain-containing protein [Pseudomonadales bacterium]
MTHSSAHSQQHEEILLLLPWYLNDTLTGNERTTVVEHLKTCVECQRSRDEMQAMQLLVSSTETETNEDYWPSFRKLMNRIEQQPSLQAGQSSLSTANPAVARIRPYWVPVSLAASVIFALLLLPLSQTDSPVGVVPKGQFATLTHDSESSEGIAHRLELQFDQPLSAQTLRAAFIETRSNIVSGPDAEGAYLVEVVIPEGMSDAEFLRSLRSIEGVRSAAFAP